MSNSLIRSTLITALATYAATHSPVLTIARENVSFTKPTDNTPFLEAILIPANTNSATVQAGRQRFMGTFQVNVWFKENLGVGVAETIATELAALFPVVPKSYLPVSVETPLSTRRIISDGAGYKILVCDFMYRMEA